MVLCRKPFGGERLIIQKRWILIRVLLVYVYVLLLMKKLLVIYSFIVPLPIVCGRSFWRLPISIGFSQICSQRRAAPIPKKKRCLWNVRIHAIASSIWVERNNRILKTPYPSTSLNEIPLSILWSSGLDVLGLPPFYFSYIFCNLSESSCLPKIDCDSLFWLIELLLSIKKQKKWWMIKPHPPTTKLMRNFI